MNSKLSKLPGSIAPEMPTARARQEPGGRGCVQFGYLTVTLGMLCNTPDAWVRDDDDGGDNDFEMDDSAESSVRVYIASMRTDTDMKAHNP